MTFTYAGYSDIGKRENNEDSCNIVQEDNSLVAIVADGLGGHANGEVASRIAAENIPRDTLGCDFDEDELGYAILDSHKDICGTNSSACTTVAALWISDDRAIAAHVGDSRIYQFRDGKIIYQSEDHSMVQIAISLGELSADACRHHKDRNKVYNVLGDKDERPKIETCELDVLPGDRFLLCSDGFWEPITEEVMLETVFSSPAPQVWLDSMKDKILELNEPKQDNNTAVLIFIEP